MFVYILICDDGATYVGATVNLERRIRQHNKEIKGGAVATGKKVNQGKQWNMYCYVSGFPDWKSTSSAIPFKEWAEQPYITYIKLN